jgi:son of sevenless-like protein
MQNKKVRWLFLLFYFFSLSGNKDLLDESKLIINFGKRRKIAHVIRVIQQYQQVPYLFETVMPMQKWLSDGIQTTQDDDQLYKISLEIEPRDQNA